MRPGFSDYPGVPARARATPGRAPRQQRLVPRPRSRAPRGCAGTHAAPAPGTARSRRARRRRASAREQGRGGEMADAKPEKGDGEEEALQVRMRACTRGAGAARRSSFLLAVARGGGHTLTRDARVPCRPRLSRRSSGTSRRCVSSLGRARGCRAAHARRVPVRPTAAAVTDATAFFFFGHRVEPARAASARESLRRGRCRRMATAPPVH